MNLRTLISKRQRIRGRAELTVIPLTPHSLCMRGMSLCATGDECTTPLLILIVKGTSPRTLLIPTSDLPSLEACWRRAEPAPLLKTRSMGQPQLTSVAK